MKTITIKIILLTLTLVFAYSCDDNNRACFQMTDSPDFDLNDLSDFTVIEPRRIPTGSEAITIAETYECLLDNDRIIAKESDCLMGDLENIRIVVVDGTPPRDAFRCGGSFTQGGCIRDETIILEDSAGKDSLIHLTCLRASHLTLGIRGSENHPWFVDGPGESRDCICEEATGNRAVSDPILGTEGFLGEID